MNTASAWVSDYFTPPGRPMPEFRRVFNADGSEDWIEVSPEEVAEEIEAELFEQSRASDGGSYEEYKHRDPRKGGAA